MAEPGVYGVPQPAILYKLGTWLGLCGTSNPKIGLFVGRPFFRMDLGWWIYWDGIRWITVHELVAAHDLTPAIAVNSDGLHVSIRSNYDLFFTWISVFTFPPSNNGANYWNVACRVINAVTAAVTTLMTFDTSADTQAVWTDHSGVPSTQVVSKPLSWSFPRATIGAGGPGTITISISFYYRLIIP